MMMNKSLEIRTKDMDYLIDTLGAAIIQTDRTAYLLEYLQSRKKRSENGQDAYH